MFSSNASQVSSDANYIESVFSTYLYTGNATIRNITNGIDLAGEGGLVWVKSRTYGDTNFGRHVLSHTPNLFMSSNSTAAQESSSSRIRAFNSDGFSLGNSESVNDSGQTYVSWTFRKQPKFFDVVTYTGNGSSAPTLIPHNLGSVPGFVLCKATSATGNWAVFHRGNGSTMWTGMDLNSTAAGLSYTPLGSPPTATNIDVTGFFDSTFVYPNVNGVTYVAYLFAHDAGGFGLSGEDNVVSCGLATVASANAVVTLDYEPQFVLYKQSDGYGAWSIIDSMRGFTANQVANNSRVLYANHSNAEETNNGPALTSTGFVLPYAGGAAHANGNYIFMAFRRGPMKVPTLGTTVYNAIARTGTGAVATVTGAGFTPDLVLAKARNQTYIPVWYDRLRGALLRISSASTGVETVGAGSSLTSFGMDGCVLGADPDEFINGASGSPTYINYFFQRAPSFFDEVCYTGSDVAGNLTVNHNLAKKPELIIVKARNDPQQWKIEINMGSTTYQYFDSLTAAIPSGATAYGTGHLAAEPTSSTFTVKTDTGIGYGLNFAAYLFATCAGVSKVGSYTGTGTTQAINCGFTAGARFVMIKRTDSTGDWYVWDSARGIVSGNDPYLLLNSTAVEVTSTDYIDPSSAGFEISSTAPAAINASGGSYIFLAVA